MNGHLRRPGLIVLTQTGLFDILYEYLSAGTLKRLERTCRSVRASTNNYLVHELTARLLGKLQLYFGDGATAFRELQAQLQFLINHGRRSFCKSDLDIYTFPRDAGIVGSFAIHHGYSFIPSERQGEVTFEEALANLNPQMLEQLSTEDRRWATHYNNHMCIRGFFTFRKRRPGSISTLPLLQVMCAHGSPLEVILRFHSSKPKVATFIITSPLTTFLSHGYFRASRITVHRRPRR
ncbi:hypothetical protein BKA62DRAFT_719119 [Auriculariales sp. MPI-PUGE-AT-0066]|nr:hypothetical protein BKA62DRAFT_719119 [Auriculariales sp. MPI-PUGE-AT-0066]